MYGGRKLMPSLAMVGWIIIKGKMLLLLRLAWLTNSGRRRSLLCFSLPFPDCPAFFQQHACERGEAPAGFVVVVDGTYRSINRYWREREPRHNLFR